MAEESARLSAPEDATGLPIDGDDELPGEPAPRPRARQAAAC